MIETGTLLQDRYLIEKQIGAGGMGAVYLAVDQRFGSHVALKETFYKDEEFGSAFEREARLLNSLHHSALPHVSDYFTENGEYFLVMQYIEGEDLFESLKGKKQFSVEAVLHWTNSLLDALDYLHSQDPPVIHRDIKPQNLKINTRGEIILLDFGLAKFKSEDSTTQSVFGYSRRYSPLEQIQGVGTDARSDIFSLAATIYHLLTNEPPLDALSRAAAIVAGKADPLKKANEIRDEIPSGVADILNKALALNSAERFDSAQTMCDALKNVSVSESEVNSDLKEGVSSGELAVNTSANQNFPALAAFAAGNGIVEDNVSVPVVENAAPRSFAPIDCVEQSFASVSRSDLTDIPTEVSAQPPKKSRAALAVGLILLICAGLTAEYFVSRTGAPKQMPENTAPPIAEATETKTPITETTETNSPANSAVPVTVAPEQTMAISAVQNPEVKRETAKTEKNEKPVTATVKKEPTHQNTGAIAPREEPRTNGETRERIIEDEPVIDSAADRREQRRQERLRKQERRRGEIIEMSEDEWRALQRRQQDRQRRSRPFPY